MSTINIEEYREYGIPARMSQLLASFADNSDDLMSYLNIRVHTGLGLKNSEESDFILSDLLLTVYGSLFASRMFGGLYPGFNKIVTEALDTEELNKDYVNPEIDRLEISADVFITNDIINFDLSFYGVSNSVMKPNSNTPETYALDWVPLWQILNHKVSFAKSTNVYYKIDKEIDENERYKTLNTFPDISFWDVLNVVIGEITLMGDDESKLREKEKLSVLLKERLEDSKKEYAESGELGGQRFMEFDNVEDLLKIFKVRKDAE